MNLIRVGKREIGPGKPCFIVAEIGSNHDQKISQAKELIRIAAGCGADAVKFQSLDYARMHAWEDAELKELYRKIALDESWYAELKNAADKEGVIFFSSPCYLEAVDALEKTGVALYKLASPQVRAFPQLIRKAAATGKPLIISTGYCDLGRVERAVAICRENKNKNFVLLHCVSRYPTPFQAVNLKMMETLRSVFNAPTGFSDHTAGIHVAVAAAALGAAVIEKHITPDRRLPGPDHAFALEPLEFKDMVKQIRETEISLGSGVKTVSPEEEETVRRYHFVYRVVAGKDLRAGERLSESSVVFKRAPKGLAAEDETQWLGMKTARDVKAGAPILPEDLSHE